MAKIELPIQGLIHYFGWRELRAGNLKQGAEIYLLLEPNNKHDPNAVEVHLGKTGAKLGYIPKTQAIWISNLLRRQYELKGSVIKASKVIENYIYCVIEVELPFGCQTHKSYTEIKLDLMRYDKKSGIYEIYCKETRKRYIGSSKNIGKRFKEHIDKLIRNKHHSSKLQSDWNQYLADSFEFGIVEEVNDINRLIEIEQVYINKFDSVKNGYNISPLADYKSGNRWRRRVAIQNTFDSHNIKQESSVKEVASKSGCLSSLLILFTMTCIIALLVINPSC